MARIQVKILHNLALQTVVQNLKENIQLHRESCKICDSPHHVERCSEMEEVKQYFSVPHSVLCSIYKKIVVGETSGKSSPMFIYFWLLENPELSIDFNFCKSDDMPFIVKYGKYVSSLTFKCFFLPVRLDEDFWKSVLFCVQNIQILNLYRCKTSPEMLEHVGRECIRIRKIEGFNVETYLTVNHFRKLIFRKLKNVEIKNECCNTLEKFDLSCLSEDRVLPILTQIMPILFENMPNLKYLGGSFCLDFYLRLFIDSPENIFETHLVEIDLREKMNTEIVSLLKKFSPKLSDLSLFRGSECDFQNLHNYFSNLEKLYVNENQQGTQLCKIITSYFWPKLTKVCLISQNLHVDLSDFANNLPELEILKIASCKIKWNGKSYFKSLQTVKIEFKEVEHILWVSSFAQTIRELQLSMFSYRKNLNKDICHALLDYVPFPKLEVLALNDLEYDFDFLTKIISTFSALKIFWLFRLKNGELLDNVYKFVKDNNYQCTFD